MASQPTTAECTWRCPWIHVQHARRAAATAVLWMVLVGLLTINRLTNQIWQLLVTWLTCLFEILESTDWIAKRTNGHCWCISEETAICAPELITSCWTRNTWDLSRASAAAKAWHADRGGGNQRLGDSGSDWLWWRLHENATLSSDDRYVVHRRQLVMIMMMIIVLRVITMVIVCYCYYCDSEVDC